MDKADKLALIFKESLDTYKAKNADYGDSFSKSYQEFGLTAPIVRMSDKLERLKTLSKAEAQVKDESIKDTLIDLGNYAFMTALELDEEETKIKECEDLITERLEARGRRGRDVDKVKQESINNIMQELYRINGLPSNVEDESEYTEGDKLNI